MQEQFYNMIISVRNCRRKERGLGEGPVPDQLIALWRRLDLQGQTERWQRAGHPYDGGIL